MKSHRAGIRRGRGSLAGALVARPDDRPPLRGSLTMESDLSLRAGQHLHLVGWIREAGGVTFISLVLESDRR